MKNSPVLCLLILGIALVGVFGSESYIGDAGSRLDPARIDPAWPQAERWAGAGMVTGIPDYASLPRLGELAPDDDIQGAISARKGPGVFLLKPGTFHLRKPLILPDGCVLIGSGVGVTEILWGSEDWPGALPTTAIHFAGSSKAGLAHLDLRHAVVSQLSPEELAPHWEAVNDPTAPRGPGASIWFHGADNCWVDSVRVMASPSRPLKMSGGSTACTVRFSHFSGTRDKGPISEGAAVFSAVSDSLVAGNRFEGLRNILLSCEVEGMVFIGNRSSAAVVFDDSRSVQHNLFERNTSPWPSLGSLQ